MSTGFQILKQEGAHYLTLQIVGWVDLFTRLQVEFEKCAEEYLYNSATNYSGEKGLVEVALINLHSLMI